MRARSPRGLKKRSILGLRQDHVSSIPLSFLDHFSFGSCFLAVPSWQICELVPLFPRRLLRRVFLKPRVLSQTLKPVTQGLFAPMCAPTLDNLDISIPCCQHCPSRDMHRCGVHALNVIVAVGECHSACRSTRRVCTRITRRRQESKIASYPLHNIRRVPGGLLLCPYPSLRTTFPSKMVSQTLPIRFNVISLFFSSRVTALHWYAFRVSASNDTSRFVVIGM